MVEGYANKRKIEQQEMLAQAFYISRWVWAKKLKLEDILKRTEPKKPMTDEAMMKMCLALNKLYGGEVVRDGN